jgi:UDP-4-amino-4,6-dideoxy-N-acetyl-beta-L-altrosamine transaminase
MVKKHLHTNSIPYGKQCVTQADIDAVTEVLKSDYLTQGPKIAEFEKAFAEYIGVKHAVAVANGTAALHLCTLALDVKPGDKVITTPITFAASANCVRYAGGEVVFADIDPETYLLNINEVERLLMAAPIGTYKGIIPVDFAGRAVDLEAFRKLADKFGCWIIEDACHAPGGHFEDTNGMKRYCGNGIFAELAIFSFHPVKHIAAGEGGMITTNDEDLYKKILMLRTHGITKESDNFQNSIETALGENFETITPSKTRAHKSEPENFPGWYYEMQVLGFNYRLTDFQAALGISQLKRALNGLKRRREIATNYKSAFEGKSFIKGQSGLIDGHGYHLYIIEVDNRKGLYDHLHENNIFAQIHYVPVHLMPYYEKCGWKIGDFPNAEKYYKYCLSLPMYPTLASNEQKFVIKTIEKYYDHD